MNAIEIKMCWAPELEPEPIVEEEPKPDPNKDKNLEFMKSIILEKLNLVDENKELNKERIRELWDDIQILAFMEEGDANLAHNANESLQNHIGPQKYKTLTKIITKIAKREIQPPQKTIKKPPSWLEEENTKPKYLHIVNKCNQLAIQLI